MRTSPLTYRAPAVAGQFYSSTPQQLSSQIQGWLHQTPIDPAQPCPKLLMVPHAGFIYSGSVAASAYALLVPYRSRIRRVILLGPAHRVALHGLALPAVDAFDTPLGAVPLDREWMDRVADLPQVRVSDLAHAQEHSLEVQLPFLQEALDCFSLVPLVVGETTAGEVAEVLDRLWGADETLIIISTDLSHFLDYAQAETCDLRTLSRILSMDATLTPEDACGARPVNGAIKAAGRHGLRPRVLGRCNSGDVTGDHGRVVGYAALAFSPEPAESVSISDAKGDQESVAEDELLGRALLARARNAIARRLGLSAIEEPQHPAVHLPGATFVTLHQQGRLRGCIGRLELGKHSLEADVRQNACRAAFEDPRFDPVCREEWPLLSLEVSLLEAPRPMRFQSEHHALAQLKPGIDGVILGWRHHRSTFLPQVWEQLPTAEAFMAALKRKAGLSESFWAEDVELACYRVQVFREVESFEDSSGKGEPAAVTA